MATARIPGQQRSAEKEVVEICNRTTKGGMNEPSRKLRYKLKVMQQPERARACGSGAKCKINPWVESILDQYTTNTFQPLRTDALLIRLLWSSSRSSTSTRMAKNEILPSGTRPTSFSLLLWKWPVLWPTDVFSLRHRQFQY